MLTRHDLISAYRKRLQELESHGIQESTGGRIFEEEPGASGETGGVGDPLGAAPDPAWKTQPVKDAASVDEDLFEEPAEGSARDREEASGTPPAEREGGAQP